MSYKTETGAGDEEILNTPYVKIMLRVLDKPWVDYDSKKETKTNKPDTAAGQVAALDAIFGKK